MTTGRPGSPGPRRVLFSHMAERTLDSKEVQGPARSHNEQRGMKANEFQELQDCSPSAQLPGDLGEMQKMCPHVLRVWASILTGQEKSQLHPAQGVSQVSKG